MPNTDGNICLSTGGHGSVLGVGLCSCIAGRARANLDIEQYALTEASYTVVRLLQHFDSLENADPHPHPIEEPVKQSNLTMMHDLGVPVRLYSS